MLSLVELNKKIQNNAERENRGLVKELHEQFPDFEEAIKQAAEVGTRTGTYRFTFEKNWQAHNVYSLVENELTGSYKPMVFNILIVDLDTQRTKPFVSVEFIIPGVNPEQGPADYGYCMEERAGK